VCGVARYVTCCSGSTSRDAPRLLKLTAMFMGVAEPIYKQTTGTTCEV
jgi:hypothetical protein